MLVASILALSVVPQRCHGGGHGGGRRRRSFGEGAAEPREHRISPAAAGVQGTSNATLGDAGSATRAVNTRGSTNPKPTPTTHARLATISQANQSQTNRSHSWGSNQTSRAIKPRSSQCPHQPRCRQYDGIGSVPASSTAEHPADTRRRPPASPRTPTPMAPVNGAHSYRAYGYGNGYRNRRYGSGYGYGGPRATTARVVARLRSVQASLAPSITTTRGTASARCRRSRWRSVSSRTGRWSTAAWDFRPA